MLPNNPNFARPPLPTNFDWELSSYPGLHSWTGTSGLEIEFTGTQPENCSIAEQTLVLMPGRYTMNYSYRTVDIAPDTGIQWQVIDVKSGAVLSKLLRPFERRPDAWGHGVFCRTKYFNGEPSSHLPARHRHPSNLWHTRDSINRNCISSLSMMCPSCGSLDIRVSRGTHWSDGFQHIRGRRAYRCRACRVRFYVPEDRAHMVDSQGQPNPSPRIPFRISVRSRKRLVRRLITIAIFTAMFVIFWFYLRYITTDRPPSGKFRCDPVSCSASVSESCLT